MPNRPVFIHISKNAGTSIVASASDVITIAGHRTAASWVSEHGRAAPLFAVIRNPFDRVVSEYWYRKRRYQEGEQNLHLANLNRSFEDWTLATYRDGEFQTRAFFEDSGTPYNGFNMIGDTLIWFLPQLRWLCDDDGLMLVDDRLRYENLDEDWRRVSRKHGIDRDLVHRNASPRDRDYRRYFTPRTRDLIEHYYREDLEAFGYRF